MKNCSITMPINLICVLECRTSKCFILNSGYSQDNVFFADLLFNFLMVISLSKINYTKNLKAKSGSKVDLGNAFVVHPRDAGEETEADQAYHVRRRLRLDDDQSRRGETLGLRLGGEEKQRNGRRYASRSCICPWDRPCAPNSINGND